MEGGLESKAPPSQLVLPLCFELQARADASKEDKGGEAKSIEHGWKAGVQPGANRDLGYSLHSC